MFKTSLFLPTMKWGAVMTDDFKSIVNLQKMALNKNILDKKKKKIKYSKLQYKAKKPNLKTIFGDDYEDFAVDGVKLTRGQG